MTFENFKQELITTTQSKLGNDAYVTTKDVVKNNDVSVPGLILSDKGRKGLRESPIIYLNNCYDLYQKGSSMDEIADGICDVYKNKNKQVLDKAGMIRDFDICRHRIVGRLINAEKNEKLLVTVPHVKVKDLVVIFQLYLSDEMSTTITNWLMKMWDISLDELVSLAKMNTRRLLGSKLEDLNNIVRRLTGVTEGDVPNMDAYCLTNRIGSYGAILMLDNELLSEIGDSLGGDYYILPSSVHECIIIPTRLTDENAELSAKSLKEIVHSVNTTVVSPDEFLSDSVYYWDNVMEELLVY